MIPNFGFPITNVGNDRVSVTSQGLVRPDSFWFFLTFDVPDR